MAIAIGVVVLLLAAIGVSAAALPGCDGCHLRGPFGDATKASAHAGVPCAACHGGGRNVTKRLNFGTQMVFGMALRLTKVDPSFASVESPRCLACHQAIMKGRTSSNGLRIVHAKCSVKSECTDCHSATAHGTATSWTRGSTMEKCFACHGGEGITKKCDACHAAKLPRDRIRTGTFAVTHGENWRKTHGMGDMRICGACHPNSKCAGCHGSGVPHGADFMTRHPEAATARGAKCSGCHKSAFCLDCHKYEMPHPKTFVVTHSSLVKSSGDKACKRCHADNDCVECHVRHVHPTTLEELKSFRGSFEVTVTR